MVEGANEEYVPSASGVGGQLNAERQRQNLELSDIAARTRIPLRHLQAIESGRSDRLPALPYSAGFVKSYATLLGLDGQALSRAFREEMGNARRAHFEPEAYEPVDPSRVPSRLLAMIALGVALLLGMGYLLLRFENDNVDLAKLAADTVRDERPLPAKPVAPSPVAAAAAPAMPAGPITLNAVEDVWVKVSERDGSRTYLLDTLKAGQSFTLPDDAIDPILRTGRPEVLKVMIGSTALPPAGEPDQLVRAYSLKRANLVAIATAPKAKVEAVPDAGGDTSDIADSADLPRESAQPARP